MGSEALGIENSAQFGLSYIKIDDNMSLMKEWVEIYKFISLFFKTNSFEELQNISLDNFKFINYGSNELIYVVKSKCSYYTLVVGQPTLEYGALKKEYNNLKNLSRINKEAVVKPLHYFTDGKKELYISRYIYQARCISYKNNKWGMYIPEPEYRFENFSSFEENLVNTCMVTNLVRLYNQKKELGLINCKLRSGDFILDKNWSYQPKTMGNTLDYMKLIAARDVEEISLKDYLNELRRQLIKNTTSTIKNKISIPIIEEKSRYSMTSSQVETGIKLGLQYNKQNKSF